MIALLRVVVALALAMLAWLAVASNAASAAERSPVACAYDSQFASAQVRCDHTERGPPRNVGDTPRGDAADPWSQGPVACPSGAHSQAYTTSVDLSPFVVGDKHADAVGTPTATMTGDAQGTRGDPWSHHPVGVAAKTASGLPMTS